MATTTITRSDLDQLERDLRADWVAIRYFRDGEERKISGYPHNLLVRLELRPVLVVEENRQDEEGPVVTIIPHESGVVIESASCSCGGDDFSTDAFWSEGSDGRLRRFTPEQPD